MKVENSLNPNCSEAVMRIRTDRLSAEEKERLYNTLDGAIKNYDYETYINEGTSFGVQIITVSGDMPFNKSEELENITSSYDVDIESDET
jgi:hypothetical protein